MGLSPASTLLLWLGPARRSSQERAIQPRPLALKAEAGIFCGELSTFAPGHHDEISWLGTRHSRDGSYGMSAGAPYSGLMFAVRMTLAHFSVSLARNFPNSAGELGGSTTPQDRRGAL